MMKFSKTLLVVLGVVASLAFVGLMLYVVIQVNQLHAVAIANRSAGFANPRNWMLIAAYCWAWVWLCRTRPSRRATPSCVGPRKPWRPRRPARNLLVPTSTGMRLIRVLIRTPGSTVPPAMGATTGVRGRGAHGAFVAC